MDGSNVSDQVGKFKISLAPKVLDLAKMDFAKLDEEERHLREDSSEDELELFDLLKKPKMTKAENQKVRLAAKALFHRLRDGRPKVLVQDWFKDKQTRERVRSTMENVLDGELPETYDRAVFTEKCNKVFQVIFDAASSGWKWVA